MSPFLFNIKKSTNSFTTIRERSRDQSSPPIQYSLLLKLDDSPPRISQLISILVNFEDLQRRKHGLVARNNQILMNEKRHLNEGKKELTLITPRSSFVKYPFRINKETSRRARDRLVEKEGTLPGAAATAEKEEALPGAAATEEKEGVGMCCWSWGRRCDGGCGCGCGWAGWAGDPG